MTVWLNATPAGLAVQYDLSHVVQACAVPVVIPVATLPTACNRPCRLTTAPRGGRPSGQQRAWSVHIGWAPTLLLTLVHFWWCEFSKRPVTLDPRPQASPSSASALTTEGAALIRAK